MEHQARTAELADRACPAAPTSRRTSVTNVTNTANSSSSSSSSNSSGTNSNTSSNSNNSPATNNNGNMTPPVLPIEMGMGSQPKFPSQRPYKYGMVMLCLGALINWLGLAENYIEPVRYVGVACIVTGAMLIIAAMCCWMNSNTPTPPNFDPNGVHVIDINDNSSTCTSKPPDYETIIQAPPSYDAAIKLNPASLIHLPTTHTTPTTISIRSNETTTVTMPADDLPAPPSYDETTQQQQQQPQQQEQQQQQQPEIK